MYPHKSSFLLSLALASTSHAASEHNCKKAVQARAAPVTVTNILPTKSIVSPKDAMCTVTYTTVLPSMGTNAGGVPTGVAPHTYTMAFGCDGSSISPCELRLSHDGCPPGFNITTTVCDTCADGPLTYTLTVPDPAAPTGESSANSQGSSGEPEKSDDSVPAPTNEPEGISGDSDSTEEQPTAGSDVGGAGNDGSDNESDAGKTVEVSAASMFKMDLKRAVEILLMSVFFVGFNV